MKGAVSSNFPTKFLHASIRAARTLYPCEVASQRPDHFIGLLTKPAGLSGLAGTFPPWHQSHLPLLRYHQPLIPSAFLEHPPYYRQHLPRRGYKRYLASLPLPRGAIPRRAQASGVERHPATRRITPLATPDDDRKNGCRRSMRRLRNAATVLQVGTRISLCCKQISPSGSGVVATTAASHTEDAEPQRCSVLRYSAAAFMVSERKV